MKLEPRGKYPGVKIHLDEKETQALLDATLDASAFVSVLHDNPTGAFVALQESSLDDSHVEAAGTSLAFTVRLGRKIRKLMAEYPELLQPRTPEQIKAELQLELEKSQAKLAKMAEGAKWNE